MRTKLTRGLRIFPLLCCAALAAQAQVPEDFARFDRERDRMGATGMLVLGGWATANVVAGGIGMATVPAGSEAFHFHLMNAAWGAVNLGIALPAFLGAKGRLREGAVPGIPGIYEAQRRTETLYLVNGGLDLAYLGAGLWMREHGRSRSGDEAELFQGFGSSFLVQGGFLLVFDLASHLVHVGHWKRSRAALWQRLQFNGTGLRYDL